MGLIPLGAAFVDVLCQRATAPPTLWFGWGMGHCLECGRVVYVALDGKGFSAARVVQACAHRERWWLPKEVEHLR